VKIVLFVAWLAVMGQAANSSAYSILAHEALIDGRSVPPLSRSDARLITLHVCRN